MNIKKEIMKNLIGTAGGIALTFYLFRENGLFWKLY